MARYIDADEEIRKINEAIFENERGRKTESLASYTLRLVAETLKKAPTADVQEVKHGKPIIVTIQERVPWMAAEDEYKRAYMKYKTFEKKAGKCPFCGEILEGHSNRFCDNCGAKMDGERG